MKSTLYVAVVLWAVLIGTSCTEDISDNSISTPRTNFFFINATLGIEVQTELEPLNLELEVLGIEIDSIALEISHQEDTILDLTTGIDTGNVELNAALEF